MKKAQCDVTALGELLVDFTENESASGPKNCSYMFKANPGGAPCNVLAMLRNLGRKTAFIGKVGDDFLGQMLAQTVSSLGIDTSGLIVSKKEKTTLAFVHTAAGGERSFSFYRNYSADTMLKKSEVKTNLIASSRIFHFGSLSMTNEPAAEATEYALETAKKNGVLISFDPNLRPMLWDSQKHAKERIEYGLSFCDILKISDDELEFMTGKKDAAEGVASLQRKNSILLVCVTKGKKGSESFFDNGTTVIHDMCPAFRSVKTIDTTGAGDTFCACVVNDVLENGIASFDKERMHRMLSFANAAAALVTAKKGALLSMPSVREVLALLKK
jgi:fructokinase